jgi:predicted O-methyltransferase YrrM
MIHLAPMSSRNEFGRFLNDRGLLGRAAEIGTHRGDFASILLRAWPGEELLCVDHWSIPEGYERQAACLPEAGVTREDDFAAAKAALARYSPRAHFMRMTSLEAAALVEDGSLDFVYIDGNHERPAIDEDLAHWWPKLKPGGIFAGHDYIMPGEIAGGWGRHIQPAVNGFAAREGLDVYLIIEEGGMPFSYMLFRPSE